jgi:hypothetical protein
MTTESTAFPFGIPLVLELNLTSQTRRTLTNLKSLSVVSANHTVDQAKPGPPLNPNLTNKSISLVGCQAEHDINMIDVCVEN